MIHICTVIIKKIVVYFSNNVQIFLKYINVIVHKSNNFLPPNQIEQLTKYNTKCKIEVIRILMCCIPYCGHVDYPTVVQKSIPGKKNHFYTTVWPSQTFSAQLDSSPSE